MNIVKSSVEAYTESDPILKLERIVRVCTKTEDQIKEGSGEKLIRRCLKMGHTSILKHYWVEIEIPSGIPVKSANSIMGANRYLVGRINGEEKVVSIAGNLLAWRDWLSYMGVTVLTYGDRIDRNTMIYIENIDKLLRENYGIFFESIKGIDYTETVNCGMSIKEFEAYLTIKYTTNRAVTHQAVRHTVLGYMQESTRYCNYGKKGMSIISPDAFSWGVDEDSEAYKIWYDAMVYAEEAYNKLLEAGCKPEEAKLVLPHSVKADLYVTGTISQWGGFIALRSADDADPQIRQLMPETEKCIVAKCMPSDEDK